jgi:H+/Cl- antiporter ClcA/predicted transcriptional regulator
MEIPRTRLVMLAALGVPIGLLGGLAAVVLLHTIALLTNLVFLHRVGWSLPSFAELRPAWWFPLVAATGGLIVAVIARWCPVIRGHGLPEAMDAVLSKQSRIAPRTAIAKPLSAAVAIGTGGPFGAEGPIIVTGGALGSLIGQVLRVSPAERKVLLASGAAAGMAATFGTPLAAVVLAIELLLFEFSSRAFVPLVVAAAVAAGMHGVYFGDGPLFHAPDHSPVGMVGLPLFAALGLGCGLLAALLTTGLSMSEGLYERLPISVFWHPAIGGLLFGSVCLLAPRALGVGYDVIDDILLGRIAVGTLAVLAGVKLVAWWIALGSGTSGGTLAPVLMIGGAFGALVGAAMERVAPGLGIPVGAMALVAMGATFAAATRTPFASIVFVFELTRDFGIVLPLMLGVVTAALVYDSLMTESLLTEKLARRGMRVRSELHADPMRTNTVSRVMTRDVVALRSDATLGEAREAFRTRGHGALPIVDPSGAVVGIVTRGDLLRTEADDRTSVVEVGSGDVVTVRSTETLLAVVRVMLEESVEHVPVVDDGAMVGICTRSDLLAARSGELLHERPQPGWMPSLGRRGGEGLR